MSSMYGVVKTVDRELEIMDGTHELPQYDTWSASYRLYQSLQFWPEGTIYVSVVDPGVGTKRRACGAKTVDGYYIVKGNGGSCDFPRTGSVRLHGGAPCQRYHRFRGGRPRVSGGGDRGA